MKPQPLICVRDVQRSAAFYCELLGAEPGHGGNDYEQILLGSELVLQIHASRADENHEILVDTSIPRGNGVVLWFESGDFPRLLERVERHGIALDREPFENVFAKQMECWLYDPDGYRVVIAGPSAWPRIPLSEQDHMND